MMGIRRTWVSNAATCLAVVALLSSRALANGATWIVDASGGAGSHFTDIPPAIAVAQQNDHIVVRSGVYSSFVLDKPLLLRGEPGARAPGVVRVQNLPFGSRCALSTLQVGRLEIDACLGGVVLEAVRSMPSSPSYEEALFIQNSADVRLRACDFEPYAQPDGAGWSAGLITNAAVEVLDCSLRGQHGEGFPWNFALVPGRGGAALHVLNTSTVSVANSELLGGGGGWADFGAGRDGAPGCDLGAASHVRLARSTLTGGDGGAGSFGGCGGTFGDGRGAAAIRSAGSSFARHSGLLATGGWGWDCGQAAAFAALSGGQILTAVPTLPTLDLVAARPVGGVTLRLRAPANTMARVWLGRVMIPPTPHTDVVGLLTNRARLQNLGVVPGTEQIDAAFVLPASVQAGDLVIAQADVLTSSGVVLYSNSVCFTRP